MNKYITIEKRDIMSVKIINDGGIKEFFLYDYLSQSREQFETDIQDFLFYSGNESLDVTIKVNGYKVDYFNNYNVMNKASFKTEAMRTINLIMFTCKYCHSAYKLC